MAVSPTAGTGSKPGTDYTAGDHKPDGGGPTDPPDATKPGSGQDPSNSTVDHDLVEHVLDTAQLATVLGRVAQADPAAFDTSDQILDAGSGGMHFFDRFLPAYNDWTGNHVDLADIERDYDRERHIRFVDMRHDADLLSGAATKAGQAVDTMNIADSTLAASWHGTAATGFADSTATYFQNARAAGADLADMATALGQANTVLQWVIYSKADAVSQLYADRLGGINGLDATDVVIPVARDPESHPDECERVLAWLGDGSDAGDDDDARRAAAQKAATSWCDTVLEPQVTAKLSTFHEQCTSTTTQVEQVFDALDNQLTTTPSPMPDPAAAGGSSSATAPASSDAPPAPPGPGGAAGGSPAATGGAGGQHPSGTVTVGTKTSLAGGSDATPPASG